MVLVALGMLFLAVGCSSCGDSKEPRETALAPAVDLSPVPEPQGLMAELYASTPGATWTALRELVGAPGALLPATFPVLATTLLGLPPLVSGQIDSDVPVLGAIAGAGGGEPSWVIGFHVKSGRELVAQLGSGADASHSPRTDATSGVVLLEPKAGKASATVALGVVGNYLLSARSAADLVALGPYVARSLPKRPQPREPIVLLARQEALKGPIVALVRKIWRGYAAELERADRKNREKHGNRAPDFGDPAAALAGAGAGVDMLAMVLESARELRLIIEPLPDRLAARLELSAGPSGAASELLRDMSIGDSAPFLALPRDALLALFSRSSLVERQTSAKASEERLSALFGDRLSESDKKRLEETFGKLARGRGDHSAYALVSRSDQTALLMKSAVADEAEFNAGARSLIKLLQVRAFAEPVRQFIGQVSVRESRLKLPGIGPTVHRAELSVSPASLFALKLTPKRGDPTRLEALWTVKDGIAYGVAARNAAPLLVEIVTADPSRTLGADPDVARAAERAGSVATAVLARPAGLGLVQGGGQAPVLLSLGRTKELGWLKLDVARPAVMGLARSVSLP